MDFSAQVFWIVACWSLLMLLPEMLREANAPLALNNLVDMNAAKIMAPETPRCLLLKSASFITMSRVTGGASFHL